MGSASGLNLSMDARVHVMDRLMELLRALRSWPISLIDAMTDYAAARAVARNAVKFWLLTWVLLTLEQDRSWYAAIKPWRYIGDAPEWLISGTFNNEQYQFVVARETLLRDFPRGAVAIYELTLAQSQEGGDGNADQERVLVVWGDKNIDPEDATGTYHWNLWTWHCSRLLATGESKTPWELARAVKEHVLKAA